MSRSEHVRSKALVRYLNRAARFSDDLELVSVVGAAIESGVLTPEGGSPLFTHIDVRAHSRLAKAKATDHNRLLVFGHLRKTVYASYVKDLYEDFVDYLGEIVDSAGRKGFAPEALRGEYKVQLNAADLLACGSWDAVRAEIAGALTNRLAEIGSVKTIAFLDQGLGLDLDAAVVNSALSYLDLRHLLVHCDGVPDGRFCDRNPGLVAVPGESIRLDDRLVRDAAAAIAGLVEHIDARAVQRNVLSPEDVN